MTLAGAMRGRRLRIAPVGEIRHRWATVLAEEKVDDGSETASVLWDGDEVETEPEIEWSPPLESLRAEADPLRGIRPKGEHSRFLG